MSNDEDGRPTENVQVVSNPNWYVQPTAGGTLFQIQHPEFGWLAFLIPRTHRATLIGLLLSQALAGETELREAEPVQPEVTGGSRH